MSTIKTPGAFYSVQGHFFSCGTWIKVPRAKVSHVFIFIRKQNVRGIEKHAPYKISRYTVDSKMACHLTTKLIRAVHCVDLQNLMGDLQVASSSLLRETLL